MLWWGERVSGVGVIAVGLMDGGERGGKGEGGGGKGGVVGCGEWVKHGGSGGQKFLKH